MDTHAPWLELWGRSLNFDEYENKIIVDRKILNVIGRVAKTNIRQRHHYHAGFIHTYGYILSNLPTRFGLKRKRWIDGNIEKSLGLKTRLFNQKGSESSFLQNVTYLASRFCISLPKSIQKQVASGISQPLVDFDFDALHRDQIIEQIRLRNGSPLKLVTDIIRLPHPPCDSLLVFSHVYQKAHRLITLFPLTSPARQELLNQEQGKQVVVRPRFNLYFEGFEKTGQTGSRKIVEIL